MTFPRRQRQVVFSIVLALPLGAIANGVEFSSGVPPYGVTCPPGKTVIEFSRAVRFVPLGEHQFSQVGESVRLAFDRGSNEPCKVWPDIASSTLRTAAAGPIAINEGGGDRTSPPPKDDASRDLAARLAVQPLAAKPKAGAEDVGQLSRLGIKGVTGASAEEISQFLANYSVNYSIPDSPGLQIVGLGTEDVVRPTTPRALALAVQPAVDKDGKVQRGLALEFAPFKIFAPTTSKSAYERSPLVRALWNTQVSIGTAKPASDDDKSLKAGLGLYSIVYRSKGMDPLRDEAHAACLQRAMTAELEGLQLTGTPGFRGRTPEQSGSAKAAEKCYADLAAKVPNGLTVAAALATSRFSPTGKWSDGKEDAHGGWLAANYAFGELSTGLGMHRLDGALTVKRLLRETVQDPLDDKAKVRQASWLVGSKLFFGSDPFNYFVEFSYKKAQIAGREKDNLRRAAVGLEWQMSPGLWIVGAIGGEGGRTNGTSNSFVTTGIKMGTAAESLLRAR